MFERVENNFGCVSLYFKRCRQRYRVNVECLVRGSADDECFPCFYNFESSLYAGGAVITERGDNNGSIVVFEKSIFSEPVGGGCINRSSR